MNNISECITLLQLMDSVGNVNNSVSVVGECIFDSKHKKALPLNNNTFNLIWDFAYKEDYFEKLLELYYAVRYVNPKEKSKHVKK